VNTVEKQDYRNDGCKLEKTESQKAIAVRKRQESVKKVVARKERPSPATLYKGKKVEGSHYHKRRGTGEAAGRAQMMTITIGNSNDSEGQNREKNTLEECFPEGNIVGQRKKKGSPSLRSQDFCSPKKRVLRRGKRRDGAL